MAWDSSRPVNWTQMVRSWLVYVAVMCAAFLLFFRDQPLIGIFVGLLVSGPLYLAFGYVLAKFGYQRKSWTDLRSERAGREADRKAKPSSQAAVRSKPAPTRRTGGGSNRPAGDRKRR